MLRSDYNVLYVKSDDSSLGEPDEVLVSAGNERLLDDLIAALLKKGYRVQRPGAEPAPQEPREYVTFGKFPQETAEPEPLEWMILKRLGDRALLVARNVIDSRRFDPETNKWCDSELRGWLNGQFLSDTFAPDERARIVPSDTGDSVFLLSAREADSYFYDDEERKGVATAYAVGRGVNHYDWADGKTWWWLRTPGEQGNGAALVSTFGSVFPFGDNIVIEYAGIRPAMWVQMQ